MPKKLKFIVAEPLESYTIQNWQNKLRNLRDCGAGSESTYGLGCDFWARRGRDGLEISNIPVSHDSMLNTPAWATHVAFVETNPFTGRRIPTRT